MTFTPLSDSDLQQILRDYQQLIDIAKKKMHRMIPGTLSEERMHFVNRSIKGFYNWDIDNILSTDSKTVIMSFKNKTHNYDWVYEKTAKSLSADLYQTIFNEDFTEFTVKDVNTDIVLSRAHLSEYKNWVYTMMNPRPAPVYSPESLDSSLFTGLPKLTQEEEVF